MKDVIVIGAGMAGLTCAQQLKQAGLDVTIVEKSAGVGGRMATRRLQGTWVDHGAQLLSVKSDSFGRFVRKLQEKNPSKNGHAMFINCQHLDCVRPMLMSVILDIAVRWV